MSIKAQTNGRMDFVSTVGTEVRVSAITTNTSTGFTHSLESKRGNIAVSTKDQTLSHYQKLGARV